jgi:hypothetical protein
MHCATKKKMWVNHFSFPQRVYLQTKHDENGQLSSWSWHLQSLIRELGLHLHVLAIQFALEHLKTVVAHLGRCSVRPSSAVWQMAICVSVHFLCGLAVKLLALQENLFTSRMDYDCCSKDFSNSFGKIA